MDRRRKNGGPTIFTRVMSDPVPIPEEGIERALEIMRSGRLFRYGEESGCGSEGSKFEEELAAYAGRAYALAVKSWGCSLLLAV